MHQCIKFILFWNDNVHVLLSVHHKELKTLNIATAFVKQILLSDLASRQQYLFDKCL